jgi:hypothetical protein
MTITEFTTQEIESLDYEESIEDTIYTRFDFHYPDLIQPCIDYEDPRLIDIQFDDDRSDTPYTFDPIDNTTGTYDLTRDRWNIWTYTTELPPIQGPRTPPTTSTEDIPF